MFVLTAFTAWWSRAALRQKEAVEAIKAAGGAAYYHFQMPPGTESPVPEPLLNLFGVDLFHNVVSVQSAFSRRRSTNKVFDQLTAFPHLTSLHILRSWGLTDNDWRLVGNCRQLKFLGVFLETPSSDHGFQHLRRLDRLEHLTLVNLQLTAEGSRNLAHLPALQRLVVIRSDELTAEVLAELGSMRATDSPFSKAVEDH